MEQPLSGFLTSSERKLLFAEHKRETDGRIRDRYKPEFWVAYATKSMPFSSNLSFGFFSLGFSEFACTSFAF